MASWNALDVVSGGRKVDDKDEKKDNKRFFLLTALLYCIAPCSVGSAIRESIWEHAVNSSGESSKSLMAHMNTRDHFTEFCMPHCCYPCLAVMQDRRAVIAANQIENDRMFRQEAISMEDTPSHTPSHMEEESHEEQTEMQVKQ